MPAVVFINLDADPEEAMAAAAEILASSPQSVLLGVSEGQTEDRLIRGVRSGFRDFLAFPFDSEEAVAALSRIERAKDSRRLGQVITLFSPKGGSGLTTLTVNLGILLAREQNKKVALIDMDLEFGDVSFFLNLSPSATLAEVAVRDDLPIRTALHEALIPHPSGVEVLAAPKEIQQAEKVTEVAVGQIIREMREMFDFVLINTGSNLSPANLKALDLSGTTMLVTLPHLAAVAHARRTLSVFTTLGYEKNPPHRQSIQSGGGRYEAGGNRKDSGDPGSQVPSIGLSCGDSRHQPGTLFMGVRAPLAGHPGHVQPGGDPLRRGDSAQRTQAREERTLPALPAGS
ncbi:MAG: AAA family ATPase [Nitrospinota bacterium]|nr:AAA family ATPase [Nitrospinota bacterium]MDP7385000.1 AAA family ATPase [Nitrospinota bacterium]